jgi:1,4-dihydroxy-2-naphthoate octaprenyltransferase
VSSVHPSPGLVPHHHLHHDLSVGLWRLADPKIGLASLVPFCVGVAFAWRFTHRIDIAIVALAFVAIFLVEVGKNAVNDLYDFRSGVDSAVRPDERSPYSGGADG